MLTYLGCELVRTDLTWLALAGVEHVRPGVHGGQRGERRGQEMDLANYVYIQQPRRQLGL